MSVFFELSIIIVIAAVMSSLMRLLKQPLLIGHIFTGLLVGPHIFNFLHSTETIETFSEFGIAILLFIVGIGLSPKVVRQVGKVAVVTGLGQVIFTTIIGFLIAKLFGYQNIQALLIAVALTFSSTIIILKLLSDRRDLETLYGRISIGFLLVQDIIATLILVVLSTTSTGENAVYSLGMTLVKGILLTLVLSYISARILPKFEDFIANSQEFLFLFSIGWGLGLAVLFSYIGFSVEIGALIAGVTLSMCPYSEEIAAKLKPLRDFFIIMFFVFLGVQMNLTTVSDVLVQALVLSLFVLVGNPLIVIVLMGILGYNKKTSFKAGLTVAQISEFSLILMLLVLELGYVTDSIMALVTLVGLITIAGSTYLIIYQDNIYPKISKYLTIFERQQPIATSDILGAHEIILFGANRIGYDFIETFKVHGPSFLAIDFDPEKVRQLKNVGINARYGDAEDPELLGDLNLQQVKLVVSTIPIIETNMFLLKSVRKENQNAAIILMSYSVKDALNFYKNGATYVILPNFITGQYTANLAAKHWFDIEKFSIEKDKHIAYLKERLKLGHSGVKI